MVKTTHPGESERTDFRCETEQLPDILTGDCVRPEDIRANAAADVAVPRHCADRGSKKFPSFCLNFFGNRFFVSLIHLFVFTSDRQTLQSV